MATEKFTGFIIETLPDKYVKIKFPARTSKSYGVSPAKPGFVKLDPTGEYVGSSKWIEYASVRDSFGMNEDAVELLANDAIKFAHNRKPFPKMKQNPARRPSQSAIFKKANELMREGYERKQAFAIAYSEKGEPRRAKKNPAPKRKTSATSMKKAIGYVNRPSQITKAAPSKRLKKRRTVNLQSPRGVFPNPKKRQPGHRAVYTVIKWKVEKNTVYGNPVFSFTVEGPNGTRFEGKTKPNSDFVIGLPFFYPGDKIDAILEVTPSGRLYMTDAEPATKRNPSSVHFDIDVNSHNARGAKAKTRVNPKSRGVKKYFISTDHKEGALYFDGVGFSKLKSSAVDFRNEENVTKRAILLADHFRRPMKVLVE